MTHLHPLVPGPQSHVGDLEEEFRFSRFLSRRPDEALVDALRLRRN
ncbi:hypothetical protein OHS81_10285 [Streptomyces sp. NBC_00400]